MITTGIKKVLMAVAGATFIAFGTVSTAQAETLTLESATFSSTDLGWGYTVGLDQSLGWRFQIDRTLDVTEIGGNFGDFYIFGDIFGAIVSLTSPNALPSGTPNSLQGVLASTVFTPTSTPTDTLTPLSVLLNPGSYALIFGSNQFGATGDGGMPFIGQTDFPGSSYFFGQSEDWYDGEISQIRFIVQGEVVKQSVPEPTAAIGLLAFGGLSLLGSIKRQHDSKNDRK